MSGFDEEPDGDPHGECAARIAELEAALIGLFGAVESALSTFNLPCTDRILTTQNAARAALAGEAKPTGVIPGCWCDWCDSKMHVLRTRMSVCPACGDKRCPRAQHHGSDCEAKVRGTP